MPAFICETCGVQHAPVPDHPDQPPARCAICEDERQYVGRNGQRWTTTPDGLHASGRRNVFAEVEPGLTTIDTVPSFAIGQHAHLIQTPAGTIMWESISLFDDDTAEEIRRRGGIAAIAISHPHFYSSVIEFSHALGNVPVWLHAADRDWMMQPDPVVHFWEGNEAKPLPGSDVKLIRVGGHFPGGTDLLWPAGAGGRGALFCGDMPQVAADTRWVSFLYSYPNMIPVSAAEVSEIATTLARYRFDRIYGSWVGKVVPSNGQAVVARSAERYIEHVQG
jgi:hypothetical protein